ncbi:MAG: anthranilate phosphoribosyltransferase [Methanomassiliicoccales archaeon]
MMSDCANAISAIANDDYVSTIAKKIVVGEVSNDEVKGLINFFHLNGISTMELLALAITFYRASIPSYTSFPAVADLCGTGGGCVRTFNISTAASFVVAGCGVPVAKHGNRSNAGKSGSADVIEALGARLNLGPILPSQILNEIGYSFFYAPVFNPAMKNVAAARKEVGGRTVFNLLGPLLNPVRTKRRQLIGVSDASLLDTLPSIIEAIGIDRCMLIHGSPGMDEASTLGPTEAVFIKKGNRERFTIYPRELGLCEGNKEAICDRSPLNSAILIRNILHKGEPNEAKEIVLLNAACALMAFGIAQDVEQGLRLAERSILTGRAAKKMEIFVSLTRKYKEGKLNDRCF